MNFKRAARTAARKGWKFIASVQLAVLVLLGLVASLTTATFLESLYDTPTAQYYVYRSSWFSGLLAFLGLNIFCSAVSRLPWKRRHLPFLLAHLGILLLLFGSLVTEQQGLDGNLRVQEGQSTGRVEVTDTAFVTITDDKDVTRLALPWRPPGVAFTPMPLWERGLPYDVTIKEFLSHADADVQFVADSGSSHAAVQMLVIGGPMRIRQAYWLWQGDASWSRLEAGPAIFEFPARGVSPGGGFPGRPLLQWSAQADGSVHYRAVASDGKVKTGAFTAAQLKGASEAKPLTFDPGWKQVTLSITRYVPRARAQTSYTASRTEYGAGAPPSAIRLVTGRDREESSLWLGLGDRAILTTGGKQVSIGYFPKSVVLPFQIRLEHFAVQRYEGTLDPSSYASRVTVLGEAESPAREVEISMNEPLQSGGFTLYQASYEDAQPRPTVSIFSVNQDPGRPWKYLGSLIIVAGTLLLFVSRFQHKTKGTL